VINLKSLNISDLPWLPLEEKSAFPNQPAIYFCIDNNDGVQYIGRSVNLKQRWSQHHRYERLKRTGSIKIAYLIVHDVNCLIELEKEAIKIFNPILNNTKEACRSKTISKQKSYIKNILGEILQDKNITPYKFWKSLKIGQNTAYRLCNDSESIPSKKIMDKIHTVYNWLPGVYLVKK
jgi:predicted GIY-YIG superfamily endonuclease